MTPSIVSITGKAAGRAAGPLGFAAVFVVAIVQPATAHEPIFAPGAHTHSKGLTELSLTYERRRASGGGQKETEQELALEYEYGVTANWTVKAEVPLVDKSVINDGSTGIGDIKLSTKYRFLRKDLPGRQFSTSALFQIKLPTGDDDRTPRLGSGSTDFVGGLLHGLESRRWYYNTDARYRLNSEGGGGLKKGNKVLLDLVGGVRPVLSSYKKPDTVLFFEFNWENAGRDSLNGADVADTGGWELFASPGIFWTYRFFAVTGGVQIPIAEHLNGNQPTSDYRFKLTTKYSF
jgi:hypothetical protein